MSNRNYLLPSINPLSNPSFKGNVSIDGNLNVTGQLTLPDSSPFKTQSTVILIPTIISASNLILVQTSGISGTIVSISGVTNVQTVTGPVTFTCSTISFGTDFPITNGIISISPAQDLYSPTINSVEHEISSGDVIKIEVGGTNTENGIAYITIRIRI